MFQLKLDVDWHPERYVVKGLNEKMNYLVKDY